MPGDLFATTWLRELTALAERLDRAGVFLDSFECHPSDFGSWALEASRSHRGVKVAWDGQDGILRVFRCDRPDSRAGIEWRELPARPVRSGGSRDIFRIAEVTLLEQLGS